MSFKSFNYLLAEGFPRRRRANMSGPHGLEVSCSRYPAGRRSIGSRQVALSCVSGRYRFRNNALIVPSNFCNVRRRWMRVA